MRRLLLLLCALLAACSTPPPTDNTSPHSNPPTLAAPTQFVEADEAVTLNNVADLKYLGRLDQPGTPSTIFNYALSPDATRLVGLNNEQILAWNLLTGALIFQTSRSNATRVYYSSDKTEIYGVDNQGLTSVYDANKGGLKTSFQGHPSFSDSAAFSPDDGWLALGGKDGTVKVWDTYGRQSLVTINAHSAPVTALAFSADGTQLATAGDDGQVRAWRWRDRALTSETKLDPPISIRNLAFAPDTSSLGIGNNQDARLWSLSETTQMDTLNTGPNGANEILQFSPDGRYILAGNRDAGLSLWTLADGKIAARLPDTQGETLDAAFSPDGDLLLTAVLNGKVSLWNMAKINGTVLTEANIPVGTQQIVNVAWTNDSRLLLFFDASGPVYLWGIGA